MLARYRLFLAVAGVSVATGLAVAIVPMTQGHGAGCYPGPPSYAPTPSLSNNCWAATNNPDWIAGFVVAGVVYALLVGLILSARALRTK